MKPKRIGILVGSLRKESFNRKMAKSFSEMAPFSIKGEIIEIGDLTIYNQDFDADPPRSWVIFREQITSCDGILFFTPEYNRSVSGVLKNAIDIGSRPYGKSVWNGKPAAVVSVSIGGLGGFGANHHLRQSLVYLNVPTMPTPETYFGNAEKLFDKEGHLIDPSTREYANKFMLAFDAWVAKFVFEPAESIEKQYPLD